MKCSFVRATVFITVLLSSASEAKTELKTAPLRLPAEAAKIVFTRDCPDVQTAVDQEALNFYNALVSGTNWSEPDKLNLEQFKLQGQALEARGFIALNEPLSGPVASPARVLTFRREKQLDQKIQDAAGATAYETIVLSFEYKQVFVKKDTAPKPASVLPKTVLQGVVFLRCNAGSKKTCPIEAISINGASIRWEYLPSTRGGESSAGG